MCKSKIHRATVTDANLEYEGSLEVDELLLKAADILPYETVMVANLANGERFETYTIPGKKGSGVMCLNGAAAHKGKIGDKVLVISNVWLDPKEIKKHKPTWVYVDGNNRIVKR